LRFFTATDRQPRDPRPKVKGQGPGGKIQESGIRSQKNNSHTSRKANTGAGFEPITGTRPAEIPAQLTQRKAELGSADKLKSATRAHAGASG
jgi:hypothetical protein